MWVSLKAVIRHDFLPYTPSKNYKTSLTKRKVIKTWMKMTTMVMVMVAGGAAAEDGSPKWYLGLEGANLDVTDNDIVLDGAKNCPEMSGAEAMLKSLSQRYQLYLSSMTPHEELKEIVHFRNWSGYFEDTYGYPHQKAATIAHIMGHEDIGPRQLVVVGDGNSDRPKHVYNF